MLQRLSKESVVLTQNPDMSIKAYVPSHKITVYLNKEEGEKDYTGFTKNRLGIAYRLHIVRNGLTPQGKNNNAIYLETLADQEPQDDYQIFLVASGIYDLPIRDSGNQTTRHKLVKFDTAEECAEYEDMLMRDYPECEYEVNSLQKGHQVPVEWTTTDETVRRMSKEQIEDQIDDLNDLMEEF